MNTKQTSELTGLPESLLIKMRARETVSLKSGPPYAKRHRNGAVEYVYNKKDVLQWMKQRRCLITAGDAAAILGISREEMLCFSGLISIRVNSGEREGKLIIDNGKNTYIWLPSHEKRPWIKNLRTA